MDRETTQCLGTTMNRNSKGHTQLQHLCYYALKDLVPYHPRLLATALEHILHRP